MVEKKNAVLDTGIVAPGFRLIFISLAHERYVVLVNYDSEALSC
jgi:hypothetical protein